jgi:hypothetical protein
MNGSRESQEDIEGEGTSREVECGEHSKHDYGVGGSLALHTKTLFMMDCIIGTWAEQKEMKVCVSPRSYVRFN